MLVEYKMKKDIKLYIQEENLSFVLVQQKKA